MFTVSGLGVIPKDAEIIEKTYNNKAYFYFSLLSKDPYKTIRHYIKMRLFIPTEDIQVARDIIKPGQAFYVRIGELSGRRTENGVIFMEVQTQWKWLEPVKAMVQADRKLTHEDG